MNAQISTTHLWVVTLADGSIYRVPTVSWDERGVLTMSYADDAGKAVPVGFAGPGQWVSAIREDLLDKEEKSKRTQNDYGNLSQMILNILKEHQKNTPASSIDQGLGQWHLKIGEVATAINESVTAHKVGKVIRNILKLNVSERRRDGFHVYWNEGELERVGEEL